MGFLSRRFGLFLFYMGQAQIWVFYRVGCGYSNFKTKNLGYSKLLAEIKRWFDDSMGS
jgi:hypothetical protein